MYSFAKGINPSDIFRLDAKMILLLNYVAYWCHKKQVEFYITSLIRTRKENDALGSTSLTHVEGRAVDFSIQQKFGWDYSIVQDLMSELNILVNTRCIGVCRNPYYEIGAISESDYKQRPIVIHKNYSNDNNHAHLQVRRVNGKRY